MIALKKILVPTDFGEAADRALNYAKELARTFGGSIDVLHVVEDASARIYAGEIFIAVAPTLQKEIEDAACGPSWKNGRLTTTPIRCRHAV